MIRLAIIGTNWISRQFLDAAHASGLYRLTAVYSRQLQQARDFAGDHPAVQLFTDLSQLAQSDVCDAVYIASPNALHFAQICQMLSHKKHVICEKPLTSTLRQTEAAIACAWQHQVILFEAFKTASLPGFRLLRQVLDKPGRLHKALLTYCQYSSRYPRYLHGELPNTFNPAFSGGSIMDIGYYCLAFALALWGEPRTVLASACLLDSGVDAHGSVIMRYPDFEVTICHSKVSDSSLPSEIQGEAGTLYIDTLSECQQIRWQPRGGESQLLILPEADEAPAFADHSLALCADKPRDACPAGNALIHEARAFARLIAQQAVRHPAQQLSWQIAKWLDEIRRQTGVHFPADDFPEQG